MVYNIRRFFPFIIKYNRCLSLSAASPIQSHWSGSKKANFVTAYIVLRFTRLSVYNNCNLRCLRLRQSSHMEQQQSNK